MDLLSLPASTQHTAYPGHPDEARGLWHQHAGQGKPQTKHPSSCPIQYQIVIIIP